ERADVFGLGAILCVILTGQPPFVGTDGKAVHRESASGDLRSAFARLDASGADDELVVLAKRCLALDPEQRSRDATEVAEAVGGRQAGVEERARTAELERAAAQVRAEEATAKAVAERRARRRILGLTAAVIVSLTAGAIAAAVLALQATDARGEAVQRAEEATTEARAAREAERLEREAKRLEQRRAYGVGMLLTQAAWEQHQVDRF